MKAVTILCRGISLGYIGDVPQVDHSVIVNSFHYEVENKSVHEYLSACSTVTHILSLGAYFPNAGANELYKKYNFDKIMLPYVKEVSPPVPNHFFQIQGRDGLLPVENLDDINKKDMIPHMSYAFTSPSCGLDAFLYVVNELKADIVNIVGMDFYDDIGYLTNSLGNIRNTLPMEEANRKWIEHCNRRGDPTDLMQGFFFNVVKKNPSTKFNLYTASKIKADINNLKIIKVMT